jgi:hypothetical protein
MGAVSSSHSPAGDHGSVAFDGDLQIGGFNEYGKQIHGWATRGKDSQQVIQSKETKQKPKVQST